MEKIYFLAPRQKWWTYFYYEKITKYFKETHSDQYEIIFCHSLFDYIRLHFIKSDAIFSIIPFLFRPFFAKKFFFNLHGNFKEERKNKWIALKLLYLTEKNLKFSDKIIVTSDYLTHICHLQKYYKKIINIPLFVEKIEKNTKIPDSKKIQLLTISSANFLKKWLGIYDLAKKIFEIKNTNIEWTIILPWNTENQNIIFHKINKLTKPENITIKIIKNYVEVEKIENFYKNCDIFIYASNQETWWWVIMEACSYGKPIILLQNELWKYIYPEEFVCNWELEKKLVEIIQNYKKSSEISENFVKNFQIKIIAKKIINLL